jgi:hypothetical protein
MSRAEATRSWEHMSRVMREGQSVCDDSLPVDAVSGHREQKEPT